MGYVALMQRKLNYPQWLKGYQVRHKRAMFEKRVVKSQYRATIWVALRKKIGNIKVIT